MTGCVLLVDTVWLFVRNGEPKGRMFLMVLTESPDQDRDWLARQLQIGNQVPCWRVWMDPRATRREITGEDSDEIVQRVRKATPWILDPTKSVTVRDWVGVPVVIDEDLRLPPLKRVPLHQTPPTPMPTLRPMVVGYGEEAPTPRSLAGPSVPLTREGLALELGKLISARQCRTTAETDGANRVLADFVIFMASHGMIPTDIGAR